MIRLTIALLLLITMPADAETVDVKYHGVVDLTPFACTDTPRSSFVQRVCYDKAQSYMLINLRGTYYHYCELPAATFEAFVAAPSMGQFYNQKIKGSGSDPDRRNLLGLRAGLRFTRPPSRKRACRLGASSPAQE